MSFNVMLRGLGIYSLNWMRYIDWTRDTSEGIR